MHLMAFIEVVGVSNVIVAVWCSKYSRQIVISSRPERLWQDIVQCE